MVCVWIRGGSERRGGWSGDMPLGTERENSSSPSAGPSTHVLFSNTTSHMWSAHHSKLSLSGAPETSSRSLKFPFLTPHMQNSTTEIIYTSTSSQSLLWFLKLAGRLLVSSISGAEKLPLHPSNEERAGPAGKMGRSP